MERYKKYPYRERYPDPDDPVCSWYAYYRDETGKAVRRSLKTRNERIAEKRFQEILERIDRGLLGFSLRPKPLSFVEFARTYLNDGTHHLSQASVDRHRQNLFGLTRDKSGQGGYLEKEGHLIQFFRKRDFKTIGVKDVHRYIRHRRKIDAAPNTILKELATLSAMFQFALSEELVVSNPVLAARKPALKKVRAVYTPNRQELLTILEALYPRARRFFLAYCNSGCRKSELANCNVRDADLEQRLLRVIRKGNKERLIPMNQVLFECVKDELASRQHAGPDDPLFVNREGRRYRSLRTPLSRACRVAGIPHISHHSLRHAYPTLQFRRGLDPVHLSKLLGHANPTVRQNIYIHVFDEALLGEAAEGFEIRPEKKSQESSK